MNSDRPEGPLATVETPPAGPRGPSAEPVKRWRVRSQPEDFRVFEEPLYEVTGEGGHTFLLVEKRGRTTEQVAGDLAKLAGIRSRDVGIAGRKDRHAVTRQWFSIEGLDPARALDFDLGWSDVGAGDDLEAGPSTSGARVLEAARHPHKLRTGHLRANRFELIVRGALDDAGEIPEAIRARADEAFARGVRNRFGDQRFGRDGDNVERALEMLRGGRPPRDRRAARFLVSALQSAIFNAVLDRRGADFDGVRLGDVARVEESGGLFWVDDLEREAPRAAAFEISATGPIFGSKMREPRDEIARLEADVQASFGLPALSELRFPRGVRAPGTRRPLRIRPEALALDALADATGFRLTCRLPPGAYVTVLLDALVGRGEWNEGPPRSPVGAFAPRVS